MNITWVDSLTAWVGSLTLLYAVIKYSMFVYTMIRCYVVTSGVDLKRYGDWAVVTGATDGIGREFALQLAQRRFNVVLVSRTMSKLQQVSMFVC